MLNFFETHVSRGKDRKSNIGDIITFTKNALGFRLTNKLVKNDLEK